MTRRVVAALWVAASTLPLILGATFLFGCCVLPFHRFLHHLMPVCERVQSAMRSDAASAHRHETTPAQEKEEPARRIAGTVPHGIVIAMRSAAPSPGTAVAASRQRSLMRHGAVRCDQDVGLHIFIRTFLI
jgi:hypothetical protein